MSARSLSVRGTSPDDLWDLQCARCQSDLVVHLPDPQTPDRLLGTCPDCKSWFLIDARGLRMTRVPEEIDRFQDAPHS